MNGTVKKILIGLLALTSLFASACSAPEEIPERNADISGIQWCDTDEEAVTTKGIATNLTLSIGGGDGKIWAKVKNNFTLLSSTIRVYIELYSSETYQESYTSMNLENRGYVKDLDMGDYITISVPTDGAQKYWQARMRYKFDNRDWVTKCTSTLLYSADGEVIDEPEQPKEKPQLPEAKGPFYDLRDAYDKGWLKQEELLSIAYYHHSESYTYDLNTRYNTELMGENYQPIAKSPEALNENAELNIKKSLRDLVYTDTSKLINLDDINVFAYYGTYNGGYVIRISYTENDNPFPAYMMISEPIIGDVQFFYPHIYSFFSGNGYSIGYRILYWKPDNKNETEISDKQFFGLDEAYENKLISEDNLKSIAQYYNSRHTDEKTELPELDDSTRESIKTAYCEMCRLEKELYDQVGIPSTYYGTYNNCTVIEILTTCEIGGDPICYPEYDIGGVTFYRYCPLMVYKKI